MYIYTGGQKIAMISPADHRIHLTGITSQSGEELEVNWAVPSNFTARTGDQVCWQQYNSNGVVGGLDLRFSDGQTAWRELANDGQQMNQNNTQGIWQSRCATFDDHVNATLLDVSVLKDVNTPASSTRWDLLVSDVSITRLDGTIVQLFASGKSPGLSVQTADPNYDTGFNAQVEDVLASQDGIVPATTSIAHCTHFFVGDHLGTAQMEFAQGGYPVWQGQFAPFGDELDSQATANHYKFTGKERDTESGNDYFGARYYASSMGRFMSPDWASNPVAIPFSMLDNPQSLNLYSYVGNNPLSRADADGHTDYTYDQTGKQIDKKNDGFWHNLFHDDTYTMNLTAGGSISLNGPVNQLADGQQYTIVSASDTTNAASNFVGQNAGKAEGMTMGQFADASKTGRPFDFKQQLSGTSLYMWSDGKAYDRDGIGNITWGYLSAVAVHGSIDPIVAHAGAAYAQVLVDRTSRASWIFSHTGGDRPQDYDAITAGRAWQGKADDARGRAIGEALKYPMR